MSETPILQFGSSRFLLAHVDLFISQAMERGAALGPVAVVQTTGNPRSAARVAALTRGGGYPVRIRGMRDGAVVDVELRGNAIALGLNAASDWEEVRRRARMAQVILSNTGDRGFETDVADSADLARDFTQVPRSFPAKIGVLLYERFQTQPEAPLTLFPCELVPRNGDVLRGIVDGIAAEWGLPLSFRDWLARHCVFANSLVDRIVSEPIEPVGAVAEPYALWAVEDRLGLVLPCAHPSIVLTGDLDHFEGLKLHVLNLGHSFLAGRWLAEGRAGDETVRAAMADAGLRADLESVWSDEVLPVLAQGGAEAGAAAYVGQVRERFLNPFLDHRLADIADNHAAKTRRRVLPILTRGAEMGLEQPLLTATWERVACERGKDA